MKYLHIIEYSSLIPYKIPVAKQNQFDLKVDNSIIRSYVDTTPVRIMESLDYLFDEVKLSEITLPLNDVVIFDNLDISNENQKIAYVFECPICHSTFITTDKDFDFCNICENDKFLPEVIGLINVEQMEQIAIDENDVSTLIQTKDGKITYRDDPELKVEEDGEVHYLGDFTEQQEQDMIERMVK